MSTTAGFWGSALAGWLMGAGLATVCIAGDYERLHCWSRPDAGHELFSAALAMGALGMALSILLTGMVWPRQLLGAPVGVVTGVLFGLVMLPGEPTVLSATCVGLLAAWLVSVREPGFPLILLLALPGGVCLVGGPLAWLANRADPHWRWPVGDLVSLWARVLVATLMAMLAKRALDRGRVKP